VAAALADPDLGEALEIVAQRLRDEVGASALRITLETSLGGRLASATSAQDPAARTAIEEREPRRAIAVLAPAPSGASEAVRWIRVASPHPARRSSGAALCRLARAPIHSPAGDAGEILLAVHSMALLDRRAARLLAAVASHLWVALDRARLRREATDAEVLRRADEAKSALLDAVSHDLRTPLASIIASAESLQQPGVQWSEGERDAFASAIEQEALRLDRIVGNLLDLGRLRAGAIHADKAWYEPVALIREVVRRLGPLVDRYGHALRLDLPEELPPVAMDYSKVDQILTNLVENAAKHAPTGSQIRVAAAIEDDSLQVVVEDNGPGLDATALERIFEPFYRLGRPAQRGSGLGLAVARGLVEAHRGRIWAEQRPAGGTRFLFTIPEADEE
jgi:K+-sensing histidine kinase KdpD